MNFFKNFLQRMTTLLLGVCIVALLMFNYVNTAQAGRLDDSQVGKTDSEGNVYKKAEDNPNIRGMKRAQIKLKEAENDNRASTDGQTLSRNRDLRAYDDDASLREKFGDTVGNVKETFQRATQSVAEQDRTN